VRPNAQEYGTYVHTHVHAMPTLSQSAYKSSSASCTPIVCHRCRVRGDLVHDSARLQSFPFARGISRAYTRNAGYFFARIRGDRGDTLAGNKKIMLSNYYVCAN